MAKRELLRDFIKELQEAKFGRGEKFLWKVNEDRISVTLYTDGHSYHITATDDYLGCTASTRKPRPGEDWTRGSDLADGKLNRKTWDRILRDIIAYELKTISAHVLNPISDGWQEAGYVAITPGQEEAPYGKQDET
jgi:hypothetical protein